MNVQEIKELIHVFTESGLAEMEAEVDGNRLHLRKKAESGIGPGPWNTVYATKGATTAAEAAKGAATAGEATKCAVTATAETSTASTSAADATAGTAVSAASAADTEAIKAPLVGVFYEAPAPGEEPFVREGQKVKKGDVICVIEAMKMMNELKADFDGTIEKVEAKNGEAVEFGQVLFEVRKC